MNIRFLILLIPAVISYFLEDVPVASYLTAWLGSFFILFLTIGGYIKPLTSDLGGFEQAMRPVILTHIIFAGYMACTSIFFFIESMGYYYFEQIYPPDENLIISIAQCQRYYLVCHIAYATGLLIFMKQSIRPLYKIEAKSISGFMLRLAFYFTLVSIIIRFIPGLTQLYIVILNLSTIASVISLAYAIPESKTFPILISGIFFTANYLNALSSGWKEAIIVPLILLGTFLYPHFKKTILIIAPVILFAFFYFVPAYNGTVRQLTWSGETDAETASEIALEQITSGEMDLAASNWDFFTNRLSEIGMFVKYKESVPDKHPFYGLQILKQAFESIIPRAFYPDKPNIEELVMERVVNEGVINVNSNVSAKPPPIIDGYLSGGFWGVLVTGFLLGAFAMWVSNKAEALFGSYLIGSGLIYTGLFQTLWRGNCFEFMLNNFFWGLIIMFVLFKVAKNMNILVPVKS